MIMSAVIGSLSVAIQELRSAQYWSGIPSPSVITKCESTRHHVFNQGSHCKKWRTFSQLQLSISEADISYINCELEELHFAYTWTPATDSIFRMFRVLADEAIWREERLVQ